MSEDDFSADLKAKIEKRVAAVLDGAKYESEMDYEKWVAKLPFFPVPPHLEIQVIPPFLGAVVRFRVRSKDNPGVVVSAYFDAHDRLGYMGKPYWEICHEETQRFLFGEEKAMWDAIEAEIGFIVKKGINGKHD